MKKPQVGKEANFHLCWKAGNNALCTFIRTLISILNLLKIKSIRSHVRLWLLKAALFIRQSREGCTKAWTLFETIVGAAVLGTLLAVAIPIYTNVLLKARIISAITDIAEAAREIEDYLMDNGDVPEILDEIKPNLKDPWGRSYEYLPILGRKKQDVQGKWRKDRFLIPINSDFDLYSRGKDGESKKNLNAKESHDDIVRANNGDFVGLGSKY